MSDLKLFNLANGAVTELEGGAVALEKSLQTLFERNLETLLGVRFLASELSTTNGGRIDSLGVDENNCPVIIEYKRATNENVINQGLFYLDWLMDHRGDFELLVRDMFDKNASSKIEWSAPRLICIAGGFTKFDEHAVRQMNRNIELVRYRKFGDELLLLELVTAAANTKADPVSGGSANRSQSSAERTPTTVSRNLESANQELSDRYEAIRSFLLALGDDVQEKTLKYYVAFRRLKNFACVEVKPMYGRVTVFLKIDPDSITLEEGYTRDVREIGHYGTGDLEVTIHNDADFERAKPLFIQSYEAS